MKALNLVLHCGGKEVALEQLEAVKTPAPVGKHFPVSHMSVRDELITHLGDHGLQVAQEAVGLSHEGNRAFGMAQLINGSVDRDFGLVVGWRNSHDKSFSAGFLLGAGVFVCDNLSFMGEFKLSRRHTRHVIRDLPKVVNRAVAKLVNARRDQQQRMDAMREFEMSDRHAHDFILRAHLKGAITTQRIVKVTEQWHTPAHPEFAEQKNMWRMFNAFTESLKGTTIENINRHSTAMHNLCDIEMGLTLGA